MSRDRPAPGLARAAAVGRHAAGRGAVGRLRLPLHRRTGDPGPGCRHRSGRRDRHRPGHRRRRLRGTVAGPARLLPAGRAGRRRRHHLGRDLRLQRRPRRGQRRPASAGDRHGVGIPGPDPALRAGRHAGGLRQRHGRADRPATALRQRRRGRAPRGHAGAAAPDAAGHRALPAGPLRPGAAELGRPPDPADPDPSARRGRTGAAAGAAARPADPRRCAQRPERRPDPVRPRRPAAVGRQHPARRRQRQRRGRRHDLDLGRCERQRQCLARAPDRRARRQPASLPADESAPDPCAIVPGHAARGLVQRAQLLRQRRRLHRRCRWHEHGLSRRGLRCQRRGRPGRPVRDRIPTPAGQDRGGDRSHECRRGRPDRDRERRARAGQRAAGTGRRARCRQRARHLGRAGCRCTPGYAQPPRQRRDQGRADLSPGPGEAGRPHRGARQRRVRARRRCQRAQPPGTGAGLRAGRRRALRRRGQSPQEQGQRLRHAGRRRRPGRMRPGAPSRRGRAAPVAGHRSDRHRRGRPAGDRRPQRLCPRGGGHRLHRQRLDRSDRSRRGRPGLQPCLRRPLGLSGPCAGQRFDGGTGGAGAALGDQRRRAGRAGLQHQLQERRPAGLAVRGRRVPQLRS